MPRTSPVFRVFVSSTFGDFEGERTALHERVFPRLRSVCASHGAEFQAIDLRWGISSDAAADRRIAEICLGEVERCRSATKRPNFLLLLGNRYGTTLLPSTLNADAFRRLLERLTNRQARRVVERWYLEDLNSIPAVFVLQSRRSPLGGEAWDADKEELRSALIQAAEDAAESGVLKLLRTSLTEQEAAHGIPEGGPDYPGAVHVFRRTLEGLPRNAYTDRYRDVVEAEVGDRDEKRLDPQAAESLHQFHAAVEERMSFGPDAVTEFHAAWDPTANRPTKDHLHTLCDDVYEALAGVIKNELQTTAQVDPHQLEEQAHQNFGVERHRFTTGRRQELDELFRYISSDTTRPLLLVGSPGIGKTTLLAHLAQRATDVRPVVARFIGATPRSTDLRSLLSDIYRALPAPGDLTDKHRKLQGNLTVLAEAFREGLAFVPSKPGLVLILDALDQFTGIPDLSWLPTELPPGVKVILSTQRGSVAESAATEIGAITMPVGTLSVGDGDELLSRWLDGAGRTWLGEARRTLTPQQRAEVLSSFAEHGNPLHLRLAFEEARRWASYTHVLPGTLASDASGILQQLLDRLEADHGPALVGRTLGLLAASRYGLREAEILDLVSADADVFDEIVCRMPESPPLVVDKDGSAIEKRLPPILWARLYADLEPYLSERWSEGGTLLNFYHRQLTETVTARYLHGEKATAAHRLLAEYFNAQPLNFTDDAQSMPNIRKLVELPYQQAHGGCWDELLATLTDFDFLQRKAEAVGMEKYTGQHGETIAAHTGVYELQDDFDLALRLWPKSKAGGSKICDSVTTPSNH